MRSCQECHGEIPQWKRKQSKYCSGRCGKRAGLRVHRELNPPTGLPTPTAGALAELRVAADLMARRWHVFRALSPACPSDLVILRSDKVLRVQVRSAYRTKDGRFTVNRKNSEHDILALHFGNGEIRYEPALVEVPD